MYATNPLIDEVEMFNAEDQKLEDSYQKYFAEAQKKYNKVPNVKGMSGMDAVSILENLGIKVEVRGNGKVKKQSISHGTDINKVDKIVLDLS